MVKKNTIDINTIYEKSALYHSSIEEPKYNKFLLVLNKHLCPFWYVIGILFEDVTINRTIE